MSAAAKRHMKKVAELSCALCGVHDVELHHIREGQGMSQRAPDTLVIPLCVQCHRGPHGVHGDKSLLRVFKVTELDLLANTLERLA